MTALERISTTGATADLDEAPLVQWEPCVAFGDDDQAACATCGWLADDHAPEQAEAPTADVIALPRRPALRRAS